MELSHEQIKRDHDKWIEEQRAKYVLSETLPGQSYSKPKIEVKTVYDLVLREKEAITDGTSEIANLNVLFPTINYSLLRGETVVFVGAEKTGKTSFMHNWFLQQTDRKILNVHLEMAAGQEIRRLMQVYHKKTVNNTHNIDSVRDLIDDTPEEKILDYVHPFQHIHFWDKSGYLKDVIEVIDNFDADIVYIDSFEQIYTDEKRGGNDITNQKHICSQLQHQARQKGHVLITVHHMNKGGDPRNIRPNAITGVKEISYATDHILGFEKAENHKYGRILRNVISRRHADLYLKLLGEPETLTWRLYD